MSDKITRDELIQDIFGASKGDDRYAGIVTVLEQPPIGEWGSQEFSMCVAEAYTNGAMKFMKAKYPEFNHLDIKTNQALKQEYDEVADSIIAKCKRLIALVHSEEITA